MNINEILAKLIVGKLIEENLVSDNNNDLMVKLSNGNMKEFDWKIALEEIIKHPPTNTENKYETE